MDLILIIEVMIFGYCEILSDGGRELINLCCSVRKGFLGKVICG